MVDGEDVDRVTLVLEPPAGAAGGGVPVCDGHDATNVGEVGGLLLGGPAEAGDEAVGAVGAGELVEGAGGDVVAGVVGDCGLNVSGRSRGRSIPVSQWRIPKECGLEFRGVGDRGMVLALPVMAEATTAEEMMLKMVENCILKYCFLIGMREGSC